MPTPDWYYDDRRQVGLDFADETEVATYDARQHTSAAADRALLTRLGLKPAHAMADIGCGTGSLVIEAAWMCRRAIGLDVSPAMLRHAAARVGPGGPRPEWQEAGFLTWTAPPASLDLITSKYALHHLPDFWKGLALVRLAEALRPGGRFYLEDVVFPCAPAEAPVLAEDWAQFLSAQGGYSRADVAIHIREEHSTYGWVLEGLIERSGFRLLQASYSEGVYGAYLAERL
jgi:putative AdoMet-dependent methyltransferase